MNCPHGVPVHEDCAHCRRMVTKDALIQHYARCILAAELPQTREEFALEIAKLVSP